MRRLIRSERGQALVETAIVLPVVMLILFGILDAGRIFSAWIVVTNASREGARAGAVRQDEAQIIAKVEDVASAVLPVNTDVDNAEGLTGTPVRVTVSKDVSMITPLISTIFGSTVTVSNEAVMRLE